MPDQLSPPWWRSRWWLLPGIAAVVVTALLVALLNDSTTDDRPRSAAGTVFELEGYAEAPPHAGIVRLPWSRMKVAASGAQSSLPKHRSLEAGVRPPKGGSFVHVRLSYVGADVALGNQVLVGQTPRLQVALRADGRAYDVFDSATSSGEPFDKSSPLPPLLIWATWFSEIADYDAWVAVDGSPRDIEVLVTIDGETQVVDGSDGSVEAGRAAELDTVPTLDELGLAPRSRVSPSGCGPARRLDRTGFPVRFYGKAGCALAAAGRTPYVTGIGWAKPGHDFLLVYTAMNLSTRYEPTLDGWSSDFTVSSRAEGGRVVTGPFTSNAVNYDAGFEATGFVTVFELPQSQPTGQVTMRTEVDFVPRDPFNTDRKRAVLEWTIPARSLS